VPTRPYVLHVQQYGPLTGRPLPSCRLQHYRGAAATILPTVDRRWPRPAWQIVKQTAAATTLRATTVSHYPTAASPVPPSSDRRGPGRTCDRTDPSLHTAAHDLAGRPWPWLLDDCACRRHRRPGPPAAGPGLFEVTLPDGQVSTIELHFVRGRAAALSRPLTWWRLCSRRLLRLHRSSAPASAITNGVGEHRWVFLSARS